MGNAIAFMDTKPTGRLQRANSVIDNRRGIRAWRSFEYVKADLHGFGGRAGDKQLANSKSVAGIDSPPAHLDPFRRATRQS